MKQRSFHFGWDMMVKSSKLTDFGLLVAVPVTEATFEEHVRAGSDFLMKFESDPVTYWREVYEPEVVRPLQKLCAFGLEHGAEVLPGAVLSDLAEMCRRRSIVLVFAHWKGPEVGAGDLLSNRRNEFLQRLAGHDSPLASWLAHAWQEPKGWFHQMTHRESSVADALNDSMEQPLPPPATGADFLWEGVITRRTRIREEMDTLFEGLISPGNRLELFDGMHRKDEVARAIPLDFMGYLDLVTCTSMVLAGHIQGWHRKRFRVAEAPHEVLLQIAAVVVGRALEHVVDRGLTYGEARQLASRELELPDRKA